jgi:hypothetical protein
MKNLKTKITLFAFLLILLISQKSIGQENENTGSKFGLGASLFNLGDYIYGHDYLNFSFIHVTIDFRSNFRLEPEVGFAFSDNFEEYSLGIGAFLKKSVSKFNILYGFRLGLNSNEAILIAPTIGGEYYFIKNFSIGSEVQLRGIIFEEDLAVFTNTAVLFRFYF